MTRWPNIILLLAMACGLASAQVKPVAPDGSELKLAGVLRDVPINELIRIYTAATGIKIHLADGVNADWTLNLCSPAEGIKVDDKALLELLEGTLHRNGMRLSRRDDGDFDLAKSEDLPVRDVDATQLANARPDDYVRHSMNTGRGTVPPFVNGYSPRGCTIHSSTGTRVITGTAAEVRAWSAVVAEMEARYESVPRLYSPPAGWTLEQLDRIAKQVLRAPVVTSVVDGKLEVATLSQQHDELNQVLSQLR